MHGDELRGQSCDAQEPRQRRANRGARGHDSNVLCRLNTDDRHAASQHRASRPELHGLQTQGPHVRPVLDRRQVPRQRGLQGDRRGHQRESQRTSVLPRRHVHIHDPFRPAGDGHHPAERAARFRGARSAMHLVDPTKNPCMFSKTRPTPTSKDAMLRVLVPAVAGEDPWGRA